MTLDELLKYLDQKIDAQHLDAVERLHIDAMNFRQVPYLPLSLDCPRNCDITEYPYGQAFYSDEMMLYNELAGLLHHVELQDDYPLQIRANHGVGIIPSLFGQNSRMVGDNMPWVDPVSGMDSLLRILDAGPPDPDTLLGQRVRVCLEYYREQLWRYPLVERYARITQPDMQGPFDILHLLAGNDIYYLLYDNTELVHKLLALITETYIKYRNHIDPYLTDRVEGEQKSYVHHAIYDGRVLIKDDTATATISQEMYREFVLPYNERIFQAFGTGSLHFCGAYKPWIYPMLLEQSLSCVNFGNPDQQDFAQHHQPLTDAGVCVVGVGEDLPYDFVKDFAVSDFTTGITTYAWAQSHQQAQGILERHKYK